MLLNYLARTIKININMKTASILVVVLIAIFLNACNPGDTPSSTNLFQIDPKISQFYYDLGGLSTLGPPISESITLSDGLIQQYFQGAILEYDPKDNKSHLVPVGHIFSSREDPISQTSQEDGRMVDGFLIPNQFLALYDRIGAENVGRPLNNARHNSELDRFEQYFENVGFCVTGQDPNNVQMLPYGSWQLARNGLTPTPLNAIPNTNQSSQFASIINGVADRLGSDLTGDQLSTLFFDKNNNAIQLYYNIGMAISPAAPGQVRWLLLPQLLGIQPTPLVPRRDGAFYFWSANGSQDELGHNIPNPFWDYITQKGGLEVSGIPITELFYPTDDKTESRQCFEHLCMDYDKKQPGSLRIHPAPLGYQFYQLHIGSGSSPSPTFVTVEAPISEIVLQTWETYPNISADQSQEIGVYLTQNGVPMGGETLTLYVKIPDGSYVTYIMPPSNINGQTAQVIAPINAPNNTVISYKVCMPQNPIQFCFEESYIINTP